MISDKLESEVRGYVRAYPTVFKKATDSRLFDEGGKEYVDFLAGAGSLNYGHNNPDLKKKLVDYLSEDGIVHGLDMATTAKERFMKTFHEKILTPRDMNYKFQFPGPTGTNAVEAAIKLARKVTGRTNIIAFTNGFHGVTLGALPSTGNRQHRGGSVVPLNNTSFMPYDGYMGEKLNTIDYVRRCLEDNSSGLDIPAAFIVETVQGEGGINVASKKWLQDLAAVAKEFNILIIIDDIQMGCGRTGTFFSHEESGIEPDMIVLSKSLSGFGLPFSLLLLKPEHDKWEPGEHNGTFRGHNLAFVTATEAINMYWSTQEFEAEISEKGKILRERLQEIARNEISPEIDVRGKGMAAGVDCVLGELSSKIQKKAFENGLILETCGHVDQVVKFLPSLTIDKETLLKGLSIFEKSVKEVMSAGDFEKRLEKQLVEQH
ncbi:MAG: diaminobutyrate--2-oxoglutarate transaminase [Nitrosopumilaceae archaeon]|nr:diaminobutyrate--2-oxoglutarate transaminase [Nitrosopumilaceae archaeon]NIU00348.1 diaminobutyrate--2-oxoglutarate transaminase [Nitrosopumilaceae archaeon]NIU86750.1 diaminobutyrate--2-oxoglutarate transaminase [Nitrosopumilaceae archaeon]NIV65450.1 diaminobutyrate--2-oxoglutarate transaminase [Nitrosopumilaceae archaeon]NIX60950.1 diaminobutyrate--2-oxoglutarate transaminase [Nitrosopumilaceae archaeon]